jgi:small ligand-binding sensory domain FIST
MSSADAESGFRCASALSTASDAVRALTEVCDQALAALDGKPDLAVLFVSADRADVCGLIADKVCDLLQTERLIGCTAESVVGVGQEIEGEPAMALWLARLPGAELLPMHLAFQRTPEGGVILGWPDALLNAWPEPAAMLLLGEPFTFPADFLLERMNEDHPGLAVAGGMASGASTPGESRLILGRQVFSEGAVAVLLSGAVRVRTVVSQGCRPIGKHFVITRSEQNVIYELGGKPAVIQLHEVLVTLPAREQEMVRRGLHLGRVVSEYQDRFEQGDFLVRNVLGIDPETGAVVVGDYMRIGQTVKFHIRDWQTADADLRQLLAAARDETGGKVRGALLFSCNGRGTRMFPEPHHDATAIRNALGDIPLAGFFAAGELGPVAGKNFVHGFTASIVLFEPT